MCKKSPFCLVYWLFRSTP